MADPTIKDLIARIDKLELTLTRVPNIVADPAPDPWGGVLGNLGQLAAFSRGRFPGPIFDPPPTDLSRFNKSQLSVTKEMLKTERMRLDAMEKLIDEQLKTAK